MRLGGILFIILSLALVKGDDKLPQIEWPKNYLVQGIVKQDGQRKYRLSNFIKKNDDPEERYESIINHKFEQESQPTLEAVKYLRGAKDYWYLRLEEKECIKNPENVPLEMKSYNEIYTLVAGDPETKWAKDQSEQGDCYEDSEKKTDAMICYRDVKDSSGKNISLPSIIKNTDKHQIDFELNDLTLTSFAYEGIPPEEYYCEGLESQSDQPEFLKDIQITASLDGAEYGYMVIAFEPEEKYALYRFKSANEDIIKLYDLSTGISYSFEGSSCKFKSIDVVQDPVASYFLKPEPDSKNFRYEVRNMIGLLDYSQKNYQIFDAPDRKIRLKSVLDGVVVDIEYSQLHGSKFAKVSRISRYNKKTKVHLALKEVKDISSPNLVQNFNPIACYEALASQDSNLFGIIPVHISFKTEMLSSAPIDIGHKKVEIMNSTMKYLLKSNIGNFVRKQRFSDSRIEIPTRDTAILATDLLPPVPAVYSYVTLTKREFSGKTIEYQFREGEMNSLSVCMTKCEEKIEKKEECFGVYFKRISETSVSCNFILESFDPTQLYSVEDDFSVSFTPIRPKHRQNTTSQLIKELQESATKSSTLTTIPILNDQEKVEFNLVLDQVIVDSLKQEIGDLLQFNISTPGTVTRNSFADPELGREITMDTVELNYGLTTLEECSLGCLKARQTLGLCDLFDFNSLDGQCRFGKHGKFKTQYSLQRSLYVYSGMAMFSKEISLKAEPTEYLLAAEKVQQYECASLCIENSSAGIAGKIIAKFPRPELCVGIVYGITTEKCFLIPLGSYIPKNGRRINPNTKMTPKTRYIEDVEFYLYIRDHSKDFDDILSFGMDEVPSDWDKYKLNTDNGGDCPTACFSGLKSKCASIANCSKSDGSNICFGFPANVTLESFINPNAEYKINCQLANRPGRMPVAEFVDIHEITTEHTIMKPVGLVFLTISMFALGIIIVVVIVKLINR